MVEPTDTTRFRFLDLLQRALDGWRNKVVDDFSEESFNAELRDLSNDDVYSQFGLACPEYVLVRLMGRMSISIGRRLGELYDNLPRFVAAARFGLSDSDVAYKIDGLKLDVCLDFSKLGADDIEHVLTATESALGLSLPEGCAGVGIEVRYNFNPNDSARLRKDKAMGRGIRQRDLVPIYLVFSGISPRDDAISGLRASGWHFIIGPSASLYTSDLLGLDLKPLLGDQEVQQQIRKKMDEVWEEMFGSHAFDVVASKRLGGIKGFVEHSGVKGA